MSQEMKKPEGGFSALRVRIDRLLTRTNVDHVTAKRNAEHLEVAANKHTWLQAISVANLPSSAFRVAIVLVQKHLNSKTGLCFPSLETIADGCQLPLRTARDGLDALRRQGFIATQKIGTHDPLFFFFAIPSRVAEIRHSDEAVPSGENPHSRVANLRHATSGESSTSNHRREPLKATMEEIVVPCGPPSAVVAEEAPPVDLPATPTDLPRTADVVGDGQTSDFHLEKEEEATRAPTNHRERIKRVEELAPGISVEEATAIAEWWNLSPRSISEIKGKIARKSANG